ncbi:MAG: EAL domain-containing protein [Gammaproteobacteria bacterium]|nr:EAL domain-containing protein [Gammaproteobacteria bacterium]
METYILYFDFAAIIICLFLIASILFRRQYDGISNKVFFFTIITVIVTTTFDILASWTVFNNVALTIFNSIYYFYRVMITLFYSLYALALSRRWFELKRKRLRILVQLMPMIVVGILLIINFNTGIFFKYTESLEYSRGSLVFIAYIAGFLYAIDAILILFKNRKDFTREKYIAVVGAILIQVSGVLVQLISGRILVEMFATAISLLTLSIFVEKPEDFIDFKTHLQNSNSLINFVKINDYSKKEFSMIVTNITNFNTLYNIYTYDNLLVYLRQLSQRFNAGAKNIDKTSHVYYLEPGTFVLSHYNKEVDKELVKYSNNFFKSVLDTKSDISFHFATNTYLIDYPKDFDDYSPILSFASSFQNLSNSKNNIIDISKYRTEEGKNILFSLDKIIEEAIENKSFEIYYQPIYSVKDKKFNSSEALVRLKHKDFGIISPNLFIPFAEKNGRMNQIGNIILEKTFEFASSEEYKSLGLEYIEINLSMHQLLEEDIIEIISEFIKKYNIDKSMINFELTEGVAVAGDETIQDNIIKLHELGYNISIDDFGTGYSNFKRLLEIPFSIIKIDKSIVDTLKSEKYGNIFKNMIRILRAYGSKILAEGVEEKEILDELVKLGIDYVQGFYYSKPLKEEEFLKFINDNN